MLDANILIYAFREEMPQHIRTQAWVERARADGARLVLHPLACAAFLRLVTRQLDALPPATLNDALAYLQALTDEDSQTMRVFAELRTLEALAAQHQIVGDGVVDAILAAHAINEQLTLVSHDRGFARFAPQLQWLDPLSI